MLSTLLTALMATSAGAWPGMGSGLSRELKGRQQFGGSTILLGDLATLPDDELTPVGKLAKGVLQTTLPPLGNSDGSYKAPGPLGSYACQKDTCCVWKFIEEELYAAFILPNGQCADAARGAVRLGFHDAATWKSTMTFGGADGSILLNPDELARSENNGLADHVAQVTTWYNKYKSYGVTAADLIQFAAILATVVCPLGPQMYFLVGRPDSDQLAPEGLLPLPSQDAPDLITLFEDKTFNADDLVALVGAHTTSTQEFVDPTLAGEPQDSTDGIWDVLFYNETLLPDAPKGVFRFHSDISISQYSETSAAWQVFAAPNNGGQAVWNLAFAQAYFRMSLLGVSSINNMTDCTKVLPPSVNSFPGVPSSSSTSSSSTASHTYSVSPTYTPTYPVNSTYTSTYYETTSYSTTSYAATNTEYPISYETTEVLTYTTTWCSSNSAPYPTAVESEPKAGSAPESSPGPQGIFYPSVYPTGSLVPTGTGSGVSPAKTVVTAGASSARSGLALVAAVVALALLL